jgi:membrane protease YdiL (CAAX protease family)
MDAFQSFLVLFAASTLATLIAIPWQARAIRSVGLPLPVPVSMMIVQSLILSIAAAGIGAAFASQTGLELIDPTQGFIQTFAAGAIASVLSIAGILLIYYSIFRPRLREEEVILGERLRLEMGILVRVLYGGIVEEVQFRWGLISLMAWVGILLFPDSQEIILWLGVVLSAVVFALYHLAGSRQLGFEPSQAAIWSTLLNNIWGGLIFGAAFLLYGLLAAMIAHAFGHVIWYSFDGKLLERYVANTKERRFSS